MLHHRAGDAGGRVVVTGIGLTSALGATREATWAGILQGRSALQRLEGDLATLPFPAFGAPALSPAARAQGEPLHHLVDRVAHEALTNAQLIDPALPHELLDVPPDRVAVLIGTSKGGLRSLTQLEAQSDDPERARLWQQFWPSSSAQRVAGRWNLQGPCTAPVAACATGLVAVWQAAQLVARGQCDIAIAGAVDAGLEPLLLASFHAMKALARVDVDATRAMKPWDQARSGFLVGEGGAILVLERLDNVRDRKPIYAEIRGGALGGDAHHLTSLGENPQALARVIQSALAHACISPDLLDHVNLHATATRANDPLECRAIRAALGRAADRVACGANKPQIGHLLGAAGAAELAITCLSIRDGIVPPLLNLTTRDDGCDLDAAPGARDRRIRAALKLSLGFGGHLAAVVLGKV